MATTINNIKVDFGLGATAPRVTFLQGANMDITNIRDTLRQLEESAEGRGAPGAVSAQGTGYGWIAKADGNYDAGGGQIAALAVTVLPPFKMFFEAGATPFQSSGGSLYGEFIESSGAIVQLNNAVNATNLTSSLASLGSFNSSIYWDATNGKTAITNTDTDGNEATPLKNLADVLSQAELKGFRTIRLAPGYTLINAGDWSASYLFKAISPLKNQIEVTAGANIDGCEIFDAYVYGTFTGSNILRQCLTGNLVDFVGFFDRCGWQPSTTIQLGVGATSAVDTFTNGGLVTIDSNNKDNDFNALRHSGDITIINNTIAGNALEIHMEGDLTLAASNTEGDFTCSGQGSLSNLTTGNSTVNRSNFLESSSLEAATFVGKEGLGIFIDPINGVDAGTSLPGNGEFPIKTESVMHTLLGAKGFDYVYVRNNLNLTGDHSVGHVFIARRQSININCDVGSNVTGCTFKDCNITGKLDPNVIIERSIVYSVTGANNYIDYSALYGPIVLSDDIKINNSSISRDKTDEECIIDFNNLAKKVIISEWGAGRIRVKNMVTGSFIGMAGTGGRLVIDIANTGGTAVYGGAILVDDTFSANIDTLQNSSTAGAVWDHAVEGTYTAEQVMRIMSAALAGKASGLDTLNPVFRDLSDTKNRITATTDVNGNRSAVTVDGA